jgi:hypothetical protein
LCALKSIVNRHLSRPAKAKRVRPSESEMHGLETRTLSPPHFLHVIGLTDRFASGSAWIICSRRTAFQKSTTEMSHWYSIQKCSITCTALARRFTPTTSAPRNVPYLQH